KVGYNNIDAFANGWLAFELNVLRRLKFKSAALPLSGEPNLGLQLKRWDVRVIANDPFLWAYTKATALIENSSWQLNEADCELVLEDAYFPQDELENPALLKWFNESDAWWFDNVRANAGKLDEDKRAIALTIGMMVGDYVLSFDKQTLQLREPLSLSQVFRQMKELLPQPYDNTLRNRSTNQDLRTFVAERQHTDLLFLRLPPPVVQVEPARGMSSWREEWLHGNDHFWNDFDRRRAGRLGAAVQSKQQYLGLVEDLLRTASHIPSWAIAHTENGFISGEELMETVGRIRRVEAVYLKDFSDLLGVKASIITAGG
ncbi:MAG TPA: hypothetical protein VJS64_19460, partial [Pyrinomonadaceae bacterium]|nr:hypothetical protein [Pyrinomonadaceae bacterium]